MDRPDLIIEEYPFDDGLIVSSTDLEGIITYTNRKFYDISGYTKEELIGKAHNIIRHPDMPKVLFSQLWETIHKGNDWTGVLKNLRKDGKYYWAYVHISPIISDAKTTGFTAAARPASVMEIKESATLCHDLLEKERK